MAKHTRNSNTIATDTRIPCPFCGGSGQLSTFKGVSRFLLSIEECPECAGTGLAFQTEGSMENNPPHS